MGNDFVMMHVPGNNTFGMHPVKEITFDEEFWPDYGIFGWGGSRPDGKEHPWGLRLCSESGASIMIDYSQDKIMVSVPHPADLDF